MKSYKQFSLLIFIFVIFVGLIGWFFYRPVILDSYFFIKRNVQKTFFPTREDKLNDMNPVFPL